MAPLYRSIALATAVLVPALAAADEAAVPKPPDVKELDHLWADLADADAMRAYRAVCRLACYPDASVPFLRMRLRPARPIDDRTIARLVGLLDHDNFDEREKAQAALDTLGEPARAYLNKALESSSSPETKRRLEAVLQQFDDEVLSSETLRGVRAVETLERIGTAEARRLLKELAGGAPGARLTREAEASRSRLSRMP
jgi:hypothetical protein